MSATDLHSIPLTMIDGTPASFGDFAGRAVLVVNVASKCGFTKQYAGLEALHRVYGEQGLVILGVPSNQFKGQEPGSEEDIAEFCEREYGITFPMTTKTDVNGESRHPLYAALTQFHDGVLADDIGWNFEKFLVSADGDVVARFASSVTPEAKELVEAIQGELAK